MLYLASQSQEEHGDDFLTVDVAVLAFYGGEPFDTVRCLFMRCMAAVELSVWTSILNSCWK